MLTVDYHLHTDFSIDAENSMEDMIKASIEKNLEEIAFTDHIDLIYPIQIDYDEYMKHFDRLKNLYRDKINIVFGVEIGLGPSTNDRNRSLTEKYPFDFIIGSTHDVCGDDIYLRTYFKDKDKKTAYTLYFEEILYNITTCDFFSVYGHLDAIIRYGVYDDNFIRYDDYRDIIDEILKALIIRDKGLEINMSGYKYKLNQLHPGMDILKRYKELGGKIITVGSDAHSTRHIADNFHLAEEALKMLGFDEICIFRDRKPIFKPISSE